MKSGDDYALDFKDEAVCISRVCHVVKGGRRFSCYCLAVAGDGRSRVGFGSGKDLEAFGARVKAAREARRNAIKVPLRGGVTLHSEVKAKYGASRVHLMPAARGTGIKASNSLRSVFEMLGVRDIVAKRHGSGNNKNIVRSIFKALHLYQSPQFVAQKRGKKISEITRNRSVV